MSVSLSVGMRNAVYSMGELQDNIDVANKRLATGKKVNSALDNARSYFAAQGFQKDARDLNNLLESMQTGLQTVNRAVKAVESISKVVESVQALARQARTVSDATTRDTLATQIRTLLNQVDQLARDSTFNGRTLAQASSGATDSLDVIFNTSTTAAAQTKVTLRSQDVGVNSAAGLNLVGNGFAWTAPTSPDQVLDATTGGTGVTYTAGNWSGTAGDTKIDAFVTATGVALTRLQTAGSNLSVSASLIQLRQEFSKAAARINNEQADFLTLADINEEGANLSSLQTKQQLAVQALSLANRADQAILRLF